MRHGESVCCHATRCRHEWRHGTQECVRYELPAVLETSCDPLIPCGLREIGFASYFFARSADAIPAFAVSPLQDSKRVKCLCWAMNEEPRIRQAANR